MSMQEQAVNKAIAMLTGVGAKYKIILEDGTEFGELEAVVKAEKKRTFGRPWGTYSTYFKPFLEDVKVGQKVEIPCGEFGDEELRGPISSYCGKMWGVDTYLTSIDKERKVVEVLRYL